MKTDFDSFITIVTLGSLLFIGAVGLHVVRLTIVHQTCLQAGYPEGKVAWNLSGYCIKRVDQTDTVTPLDQIRKPR